jgi:hypothetical protein
LQNQGAKYKPHGISSLRRSRKEQLKFPSQLRKKKEERKITIVEKVIKITSYL